MDAPDAGSQRKGLPFLTIPIALWSPGLIAVALDERVRRALGDIYFWPGIVPGRYVLGTDYDARFVWVTLASLIIWVWLGRKRHWLALLGALIQGALSTGYVILLVRL